jgi:hypothetical protein
LPKRYYQCMERKPTRDTQRTRLKLGERTPNDIKQTTSISSNKVALLRATAVNVIEAAYYDGKS